MSQPSPRQRQVLAGLQHGLTIRMIGGTLGLSDRSVYRAIEESRQALGSVGMHQILLAARDAGWITTGMRLTATGAIALSVKEIARGQRLR